MAREDNTWDLHLPDPYLVKVLLLAFIDALLDIMYLLS